MKFPLVHLLRPTLYQTQIHIELNFYIFNYIYIKIALCELFNSTFLSFFLLNDLTKKTKKEQILYIDHAKKDKKWNNLKYNLSLHVTYHNSFIDMVLFCKLLYLSMVFEKEKKMKAKRKLISKMLCSGFWWLNLSHSFES